MSRQIVKTSPFRDEYIEWSTIVDLPVTWGNRKDIIDYLIERHSFTRETAEEMMGRVDESGTSARIGCQWDDMGLIWEGRAVFPRRALPTLYERLDGAKTVSTVKGVKAELPDVEDLLLAAIITDEPPSDTSLVTTPES